jgi:hypothetical protein
MATMNPRELLTLWSLEQLTLEMATGHVLQNLVALQNTNQELQDTVGKLQRQIEILTNARAQPQPNTSAKQRS